MKPRSKQFLRLSPSLTEESDQASPNLKHRSRDDFQRHNLVPLELEKVSKINRAAGKISNQVAGEHCLPVLLFARERLTGVLIFFSYVAFPLLDRRPAFVRVPLVLHDGIFSETLKMPS